MKWIEVFNKEFGDVGAMIADPVSCDDILSPKQVKEFSFPYLKELTDRIYKVNNIKANLHICGHTKRQWENLKKLQNYLIPLRGYNITGISKLRA